MKADKRTGDAPRSWLVAQLGQQLAPRMPALGELDSAGAILAVHQLRAEDEVEWVGRRASGGQPLVVPVRTAGLADLDHFADLRRLHKPGFRAVHR